MKFETIAYTKMSLYQNALDEAGDLSSDLNKAVKVWDWVRTKIDFVKFRLRAKYSRSIQQCENKEVKVVLMEYCSDYWFENSVTHHYVPGTRINTNCLQRDDRVIDYLHYQIANRDPTVQVYTRRKIFDGHVHPTIRQLVVKFNVGEPIAPPLPPSPIEPLDEEAD